MGCSCCRLARVLIAVLSLLVVASPARATTLLGVDDPPTIICPVDTTVCVPPPAATDLDEFLLQGGIAFDDMPGLTVQHVGDVFTGTASCGDDLLRTYRATDSSGQTNDCVQVFHLECGACCVDIGLTSVCLDVTFKECEDLGGEFFCPAECLIVAEEVLEESAGAIVTHYIFQPFDCEDGIEDCVDGPLIDPWTTVPNGASCQNFGPTPIPADFFEPGSDPFDGIICFNGLPLGPVDVPGFGPVEFGSADTLVHRSADPFSRCEVPDFPSEPRTVDIEIVALSLQSVAPITVTSNGGLNPEEWDVFVDLSSVYTDGDPTYPPPGSLTAVKTHCNGGTFDATLVVVPRFVFVKVATGEPLVLDTGLEGFPPIELFSSESWVHDVGPVFQSVSPFCTDFHAGVLDLDQTVDCDADGDGVADDCDNCVNDFNPSQLDSDFDGLGNPCDNCVKDANPDQADPDNDGIGSACDNCPNTPNHSQTDTNGNGAGDACNCLEDTNADGVIDVDDLTAVILDWGTDGSNRHADVNGDGIVNVDDLVLVILAWGDCVL